MYFLVIKLQKGDKDSNGAFWSLPCSLRSIYLETNRRRVRLSPFHFMIGRDVKSLVKNDMF